MAARLSLVHGVIQCTRDERGDVWKRGGRRLLCSPQHTTGQKSARTGCTVRYRATGDKERCTAEPSRPSTLS